MKHLVFAAIILFACQSKKEDTVRIGPEETHHIRQEVIKEVPVPTGDLCSWQVKFSPNGGAEQQVVDNILSSEESIYMLSYSFTSEPIARALLEKSKNSHIEVILDASNKKGKGSKLNILMDSKAAVYIDDAHAIAHNKTVIIDLKKLLTGSFNFTNSAEHSNAENSLLLTCPSLAKTYLEDWKVHKEHSKRIH